VLTLTQNATLNSYKKCTVAPGCARDVIGMLVSIDSYGLFSIRSRLLQNYAFNKKIMMREKLHCLKFPVI